MVIRPPHKGGFIIFARMENQKSKLCNDAIVKEIRGSKILVEMTVHSACSGCHAKSVCLPSQSKNEILEVENINQEIFDIGEIVTIYISERNGGKAMLIAYLLPAILLISTLFITNHLTGNELLSIGASIGIIVIYYLALARINKKGFIDKKFLLHVRKKLKGC